MSRILNKIAFMTLMGLLLSCLVANAASKKKKDFNLAANPLADVASKQPDKELFDKAMLALKKGRFDVARLSLQTMLNTYPESEYRMRAKLAVGDTWYKEGGTAALTQAEAEYEDFITFFPDAPEAAEAKMKVADIYYSQMEKPDRDFTNSQQAERSYREMINMYPDSSLLPRAKQKLRDVQEVLAEREATIGFYYTSRENFVASIARLQTVADTFPLYSKSDLVWISIGDAYAGQARNLQLIPGLAAAIKERLAAMYQEKAVAAYARVITRYPMSPHVEDARDRLVTMNRSVPEPSQTAIAENDAEVRSQQPLRFTDKFLDIIKRGPMVVEAAHIGEPSLTDPRRTLAPDITKENVNMYNVAANNGKPLEPAAAPAATGVNEPPRSDRPSEAAPMGLAPVGGTGIGVQVVSAPQTDPNAVVKPVGPNTAAVPQAEKPTEAPIQANEITTPPKPEPVQATNANAKTKKPKTDLSEESSSKKKKKTGLGKLNPF